MLVTPLNVNETFNDDPLRILRAIRFSITKGFTIGAFMDLVIQDFLLEILNKVLAGTQRDEIIERIREFKYEFKERPGWEKGSPKRVNNLTKYAAEEARLGKANMPGHVRAAMNWNQMRRMNSDNYSMQVVDGMKTIVCKLKSNALGWTSIGFNDPTDWISTGNYALNYLISGDFNRGIPLGKVFCEKLT